MEKLTEKLETFNQEIVQRIIDLMETKGAPQDGRMVLPIQYEEQMYNIEGGRWLVGITPTNLIDNGGYSYSHDAISLENLCLAIDSIVEQPSKFRVGNWGDDGGEVYQYFEDEDKAYEEFINKRADGETWMEKRLDEMDRHGFVQYETVHEYSLEEEEND